MFGITLFSKAGQIRKAGQLEIPHEKIRPEGSWSRKTSGIRLRRKTSAGCFGEASELLPILQKATDL